MPTSTLDHSILTAALEGLQLRHERIAAQIAEVRAQLGSPAPSRKAVNSMSETKPKRELSAAGRKRIADAARKRWAALRRERANAEAAKTAKPAKAAANKRVKRAAAKKVVKPRRKAAKPVQTEEAPAAAQE